MTDLAALEAQHAAGHGPCGCLRPEQCASARYITIIAAQQADLARLERRRARLFKRLEQMALLDHDAYPFTHTDVFGKCRFIGCSEARWSLRMGGPIR